jgi:hypothetical protein
MLLYHPRARYSSARRVRLLVERLEDRDCPSCTLTDFTATVTSGTTVQLTGHVSDDNPSAAIQVNFSGVMSGSVSMNSQGDFTFTGQASHYGFVYATAVDSLDQVSNQMSAYVTGNAPVVGNLAISYGQGRTVTVTGTVTDQNPGGLTVWLSGVVTGQTTTATNGSFSWTGQADGLGTITVFTVNQWGLVSNGATIQVTDPTPVITSFTARNTYGNYWLFTGTVQARNPNGLTVVLGGLRSVQGVTATVNPDGSFSVLVQLQANETGTVSANLTDWWGQSATTVYTSVG